MYQCLSMVAISLCREVCAAKKRSPLHEIGSKMARRCPVPQPVLTSYKLREMERVGLYAIGKSTTLESNKSLSRNPCRTLCMEPQVVF